MSFNFGLMKYRNKERAEEMEFFIALWKESGLSKYSFCKQENIDRTSFNYWLVKHGHKLNPPFLKKMPKVKKGSFVAIDISTPNEIRSSKVFSELELEYPNGVKLRLPKNFNKEELRTLISLY